MANSIQVTTRAVSWFKQAHDTNQLDMKPSFQRNLVWTDKQKSFLIDSILNEYPVPEIYMQDITNEDGSTLSIVVDGQQRITACLEFVNNGFQMDPKDSPSFADLTFDDFTVEQKKKVYGYTFVVRLLPEMSDPQLRDIFSRLNRNNIVLNAQELRQATYWGQFLKTMNEIAEDDVWRFMSVFTSNDVKRMLDVEFISELTVASIHGVQNKKLTIDKYYQLYEDDFPYKEQTKSLFSLVTREIHAILPEIGKNRWSKKTDFYTLFVLLSKYSEHLPLSREIRSQAQSVLSNFAAEIDSAVSTEADSLSISPEAREYAANLRASSDLGARKKREEALSKILDPIFQDDIKVQTLIAGSKMVSKTS